MSKTHDDRRLDRVRKLIAIFALIGLFLLIVVLSFSDRTAKPMAINGDVLGQESGESIAEYQRRAEESLAAVTSGDQVFALVSFTQPLEAAPASELLLPVDRVNAMVMRSAAPMQLPEPIVGEDREDVFHRQFRQLDLSLSGITTVQANHEMDGVIVWDDAETLRQLAMEPEVLSIEALPPDATWGNFGVRPVQSSQSAEN